MSEVTMYRGTSLTRKRLLLGPFGEPVPRALEGYLAHKKRHPPRTVR